CLHHPDSRVGNGRAGYGGGRGCHADGEPGHPPASDASRDGTPLMIMDLRKLEHLIGVAEEGSITRAAERLHLSQQALSTSIRTLEREVGVYLLVRSGPLPTLLSAVAVW